VTEQEAEVRGAEENLWQQRVWGAVSPEVASNLGLLMC